MEAKVYNLGAVRLRAGGIYCTEGGCIAHIHTVEGRVASGFIAQGHTYMQWHLDGRVITNEVDNASEYTIINEVTEHETRNAIRNTERCVPCG